MAIKDKMRDRITRSNPAPIREIVLEVDRILRGWCSYFALSPYKHPFVSLSKFCFLRLRKLLLRRAKRRGWGRDRYNFKWIQRNLGFQGPYLWWLKARQLG